MDHHVAAEPVGGAPGDGRRVALHDDVELARDAAEQRVAHGAAHDVRARLGAERVQHGGRAGRAGHQLQQVHGAASSRVRVGACRLSTTARGWTARRSSGGSRARSTAAR